MQGWRTWMRMAVLAAGLAWPACGGARAAVVWVTNRVVIRVATANATGDSQRYDERGVRLLQALDADVLALQEFNRGNNSAAELRAFVDAVAGTGAEYHRESGGYQIPNGILSRYPIRASGSWPDARISNRGFAWARIDIPGERDLFVVSVHLKAGSGSSDAATREAQAGALRTRLLGPEPGQDFVVLAGDLNLQHRGEAALGVFRTFLLDEPWPADRLGNPNTNRPRERPYDQVLMDAALAALQVPTVLGGVEFPAGVVFDPRTFQPVDGALPALPADAESVQHLPVARDFALPVVEAVEVPVPVLRFDATRLSWEAVKGVGYRVEASGDLGEWREVGRVEAAGGEAEWTVGAGEAAVFYRVRIP